MRYSVIIPAYNEHERIGMTLEALVHSSDDSVEIVVVDQSDNELTKQVVEQFAGVRRLRSEDTSRATTMNHGAREATGDVLVFLHSDCVLPTGWVSLLASNDRSAKKRGGFMRKLTPALPATRITDWFGYYLAKRAGYMLGDNAIFVERGLFEELGGYRDKPLFEDVAICSRLKKQSQRAYIEKPVYCSSRKFCNSGQWKAFWVMFVMQVLFQCGMSVERLAKIYAALKN